LSLTLTFSWTVVVGADSFSCCVKLQCAPVVPVPGRTLPFAQPQHTGAGSQKQSPKGYHSATAVDSSFLIPHTVLGASKAFILLPHTALCHQPHHLVLQTREHWLRDVTAASQDLTGRRNRAGNKMQDCGVSSSKSCTCHSGVQGCHLAPQQPRTATSSLTGVSGEMAQPPSGSPSW
jgi:hypothetical protein